MTFTEQLISEYIWTYPLIWPSAGTEPQFHHLDNTMKSEQEHGSWNLMQIVHSSI